MRGVAGAVSPVSLLPAGTRKFFVRVGRSPAGFYRRLLVCPLTTGSLIGVRPRNLRLSVGRATAFGYLGQFSTCTGDMRSM